MLAPSVDPSILGKGSRVMRSRWIGFAGVALALAFEGCGPAEPTSLVLLTVDTLRPDRLGYAGYERDTSPAIDRLARESVSFENAYSSSGWTLPSLATVFTGLQPRDHGATSYDLSIRSGLPTLSAILDERGYDTRAFVSHILLGRRYGFERGFDVFDDSVLNVGNPHDVATAVPLTDLVLQSLRERPLEPPFFLWVHYFDPHFKYLPHPETADYGPGRRSRYDGEIAHTDRQIERIQEAFAELGLYDESVWVFLSDHGEEFREHGGRNHDTLYEEVMRVPLLVKAPGLLPGTRAEVAQLIDLVPTLLGLLGASDSPEFEASLPGVDLFDSTSKRDLAARPVFAERDLPLPFRQRSVRLGDEKLVVVDLVSVQIDESRVAPAKTEYKPVIELGVVQFDLGADPGETKDVYREGSSSSERLMELLHGHFREGVGPRNQVPVDEEMIQKLRDLGYLQ